MAGIKIGLRSDPNVITDLCHSIKATLNIGIVTDEDSVAYFECLQVLESDRSSYPNTVAKSLCNGSGNRTAHKTIQLAVAMGEATILLKQTLRLIVLAEMSR
jgi:hypothetical protein